MAVKRYEVVNENGRKSLLKLNDADAKAMGLLKDEIAKKAAAPAKKRTPANKSRTVKNKG